MIGISDHALIRFMERIAGFDVESLRLALARGLDRAHKAAAAIGEQDYTIKIDGVIYIVKEGVLVTIIDKATVRRGSQ